MKAFTLSAILFGAALASPTVRSHNLPPLPPKDGLYVGNINAEGEFFWDFKGDVATGVTTRSPASEPAALTKRSGARCNGYRAGAENERNDAKNALIDACHDTHYSHSIALQRGDVVAYGCDYGNGQRCNGWEITGFFDEIAKACGVESAGWYDKSEWRASYGVTRAGNGFC